MALTLFETPDQKVQRERKKFSISVDQELQRFTRAKGAIAVRQLQDKDDEEEAKRQELDFQRQRFRELIAPQMDAEIQRVNDTQDERTKFRDLIMPSVEQEVQRFSRAQETTKFRSLVQPSLDALGEKSDARRSAELVAGNLRGRTGQRLRAQGLSEEEIIQKFEGGFESPGAIANIAREVQQRVLDPIDLPLGRIAQAGFKALPRGISAGTGVGGRGTDPGAAVEEISKVGGDISASINAAFGDEEDQAVLQERLSEIGIVARVVGPLILDPLNFIPGLGLGPADTLTFIRGVAKIRRGAGLGDEAAEFAVKVMRDAGGTAVDVAPDAAVGARAAGEGVSEADNVAGLGALGAEGLDDALEPAASRLTRWMGEKEGSFQRTLKERGGAITESRAAKSKRMSEIFADESLTPQQQFDEATSALRGADAPDSTFARAPMNEADVAELLTTVRDHPLLQARTFENRNTQSALLTLLNGDLPQKAEWKLLERVFGPEFVSAGAKQTQNSWRVVADLLNLPRTLRTIFDHSWPLRQGIGVIARHPVETIGNLPKGLWSMKSKRSFALWDEAMRSKGQVLDVTDVAGKTTPWTLAELQDDSRLFLPKMQEVTGDLAARTEEFLPTQGDSWVSKFFGPVVEPFQRSFLMHGNLTRSDIFENILRGWTNGFTESVPRNDVDGLAWLLNVSTGRGDLGELNKYSPFLAGGIFSPRLIAARVEHALSPGLLRAGKLGVPQSARASNLAAQQLVSFIGAGISILTLASLSGAGRVELDPRSSLWGKLELFRDPDNPGGATQKIDLFGGYQQYARVIAQLLTAQGKSDLGVISERDRIQTLEQFALNKMAPLPSLIRSAATGKTTIGKDVELKSIGGVKTFLWDGLSPLSFNDIEEAISQQSEPWKIAVGAGLAGTLGELGASTNTYAPRISQQLNNIPQYLVPDMEKPFSAVELRQSRDLGDDVDEYLDGIVGQIGIDAQKKAEESLGGRDSTVKRIGSQKGYSQRVIDATIFFRSTKNQTKFRNPEWYDFVFNNQDALKQSSPWVFRNRETQDYLFQRNKEQ